MKKNKGITFIALIITIIILLILAGVSILTLTGENGLLERTRQAAEKTKYINAEEKVKLMVINVLSEIISKENRKVELSDMLKIENNEITVRKNENGSIYREIDEEGKEYIIAWCDGYTFKVYADGTVKKLEDDYKEKKLEFKVEITDILSTSWKQKVTALIGNLNGYKIEYNISTIDSNTSEEITTLESLNGKSEGTTYYVWAVASKNEESIKSNNYVIVNTSHTHTGNEISGGGCYGEYTACNNELYYYIVGDSSKSVDGWYQFSSTTSSTTRYCKFCGKHYSTMYRAQKGTTNRSAITTKMICSKCGAIVSQTTGSQYAAFVCNQHLSNWQTGNFDITINNKNYSYSDCLYVGPIAWGNALYNTGIDTVNITITHNKIYSMNCGKTEQESSINSVNFE